MHLLAFLCLSLRAMERYVCAFASLSVFVIKGNGEVRVCIC